jgi:CheY-like chemotaxis protein
MAKDAESGLALLNTKPLDLIVSDIVMPGISGYELCRKVKSNRRTKDIPVILLTTLSDPLDIIQGLESGADNFITKPYDTNYLLARVHAILTSRKLRQNRKLQMGIEIFFLGKPFTITSEKEQILDLLILHLRGHRPYQSRAAAEQECLGPRQPRAGGNLPGGTERNGADPTPDRARWGSCAEFSRKRWRDESDAESCLRLELRHATLTIDRDASHATSSCRICDSKLGSPPLTSSCGASSDCATHLHAGRQSQIRIGVIRIAATLSS